MGEAEANLRRIQASMRKAVRASAAKSGKACEEAERKLVSKLVQSRNMFIEAMNDDFNTEEAINTLLKASECIEEFAQTCKRFTSEEIGQQAEAICKQLNDIMGVCRKL